MISGSVADVEKRLSENCDNRLVGALQTGSVNLLAAETRES